MTHQREQQVWKTVPLGTLAEFRNGVNFTRANFGRGIKVINVKDFQDRFKPSFEELGQINPNGVVRENDLLKEDDIVFVRSNGNRQLIGRSLLIKGASEPVTHSAFTIRARFRSREALPLFYAYALRSHIVRDALSAFGSGTNINNLNQDILSNLQVPLPPLPTQQKIAGILSAYDDLIENNTRRIRVMDEMAQSLYREWFVHFRFLAHEEIKLVESPLGRIPLGWRVGRLDDALVLQRGFDLPTKKRKPGPVPIYASTGCVGNHSTFRVKGPGIVTGRSGSLGTVIYIDEDFWPLNTTLWVREFRAASPLYCFYLLRDLQLGSFNSGAAVPTLNRNDIHGLPVIIPTKPMLQGFDAFVQPLFDLKRNVTAKNKSLSATRALLLPKLLSGNLNV